MIATGTETWLVGDIGGTNSRFGLVSAPRKVLHWQNYPVAHYATIGDALADYLAARGSWPIPR